MSFINSLKSTETFVSAAFYAVSKTFVNGDPGPPVETLSMTKEVLFWKGSMADRVVSEKLRAQIDGVIVLDYEDYDTAVNDDDIIIIDSVKYSIIHADNIAEQNEVIMFPVKKFT